MARSPRSVPRGPGQEPLVDTLVTKTQYKIPSFPSVSPQ